MRAIRFERPSRSLLRILDHPNTVTVTLSKRTLGVHTLIPDSPGREIGSISGKITRFSSFPVPFYCFNRVCTNAGAIFVALTKLILGPNASLVSSFAKPLYRFDFVFGNACPGAEPAEIG